MEPKPLHEQVIVITGASSGIGHATARLAAERGARVVACARSDEALQELSRALGRDGKTILSVKADVRSQDDLQNVADRAIARFGTFDTWINNAGVSIYGRLEEISLEDHRLLFETNYWGVVHGSLTAARYLKHRGGTIINVGSTVSDRAVPLQGAYCASKHAVKGFTDALRMELEAEGAPVNVSLIKPGAIATPYTANAKNYLDAEPALPPPLYAPEVVAEAILFCATHRKRDLFVGSGGKIISLLGSVAPRLTDRLMERTMFSMQKKAEAPNRHRPTGLNEPSGRGRELGDYSSPARSWSLYTKAAEHPLLTGFIALSAATAALAALQRAQNSSASQHARRHPRPITTMEQQLTAEDFQRAYGAEIGL